jgi:lipoyl(octanoyl) transferase
MEWKTADKPVEYPAALETMERRVGDILAGNAPELVWLLEHPPLYTAGTSAKKSDLLQNTPFPTYETGRGGEWTYHGPGQRVAYAILDLKKRNAMDMHAYVRLLENWIIATLKEFGVEGFTREGRVGVWVKQENGIWNPESGTKEFQDSRFKILPLREAKIAAIGVRVRKWVTMHGISLNVAPDLSHYAGIVPCGIKEHGVTSLKALGIKASMEDVDAALEKEFKKIF